MEDRKCPLQSAGRQILEDLLAGKIRPHDLRHESRSKLIEHMISVLPENPSHNVDVIRGLKKVSGMIADFVLSGIARWLVANRVVFDERAGLTNTLTSWLVLRLVLHQIARKEQSLEDFEKSLLPLLPPGFHLEFREEMALFGLTTPPLQNHGDRKVA